MDMFVAQLRALPVLSALAAIFYLLALAALVSSQARDWLRTRLVMPAPSNQAYIAAVDAIRGLAALYVAMFHSWQWLRPTFDPIAGLLPFIENGDLAVPIFVVMSAFLITRALFGVSDLNDLWNYYVRRVIRIYPLYLAVILAMILTGLFPFGVENFWPRLLSEVFMLRTLGFQTFVNPVAWSLFVEASFYLVAPAFLILLGRRALPAAIAAIFILYATEIFAFVQYAREYVLWRYFVFGMLAALLVMRLEPIKDGWFEYVLLAVGILIVVLEVGFRIDLVHLLSSQILDGAGARPALPRHQFSLGLGIGLAAIIVALARLPGLSGAVSPMPLRMLASVSYSLFLWHPVLLCVATPVRLNGAGSVAIVGRLPPDVSQWSLLLICAPAFIAMGVISFLAIERPSLLLRRRLTRSVTPSDRMTA